MEDRNRLNRDVVEVTNDGVRLGDFFLCGSERQRDLLAGGPGCERPGEPAHLPRRREPAQARRRRGDRPPLRAAGGRARPEGSPSRHPGRRARRPLGRRDLELAGPAHARPGLAPRGRARSPGPPRVSRARATRTWRCPVTRWRHAPRPWPPAWARPGGRSRSSSGWTCGSGRRSSSRPMSAFSLHPIHVETRYSVRARIIDCFWAKLPVVATDGDVASEWVAAARRAGGWCPRRRRGGRAGPRRDLERPRRGVERGGTGRSTTRCRWERLVEPLERYCLAGASAHPTAPGPPGDRQTEIAARSAVARRSSSGGRECSAARDPRLRSAARPLLASSPPRSP